jgi:sugar phosphate isomerase/epimerase
VTGWRLTDADWNSWPDGLDGPAHARQTAELGLAGIELGVYDAAVELSPGRLAALAGSPVTDILLSLPAERWPTGALSGDRPARDRLVEQVRACAEVCRTLGLPVLGLWPGADPVGADVVEGLRRVVEAAGDVRIAVEYKPDTAVATAAESLALCTQVPGLGVLLDTGHAYALGEDPAAVVTLLGPLLLHCHLGDADLGGGDDDLPCGRVHDLGAFVAALDASGFQGTASFDLYGAVVAGVATGRNAVRESRDHVLSRRG